MTKLQALIQNLGDEQAARLFRVKKRTAMSWRLGERRPRPKQARVIVENSNITFDDIYRKAA
jgi:hypothetical protein